MTTLNQHRWYSLDTHHSWEDVLMMMLGAVVILAPIFIGGSDSAVVLTGMAGVAIVGVAALRMTSLRRWEEWLQLACGLWLVAAPFVLSYAGAQRALHVSIGLAVCALAALGLWQDRASRA